MAHLVEFFLQNAIFRWWRLVLRDPSETIFRGIRLNWSGLHSTTFFLQNRELGFPNSSPSLSSSHVRCPVSHQCQQWIPTLYRRRLMHTPHQNHGCHRKVRSENDTRTERKNGRNKRTPPQKKDLREAGSEWKTFESMNFWSMAPACRAQHRFSNVNLSIKSNVNHHLSQLNLHCLLTQLFLTSSS
jgi:hypothetical protein